VAVANNFEFAADKEQRVSELRAAVEILESLVIECPMNRILSAARTTRKNFFMGKRTFCSRQCSMTPFFSTKNRGFHDSKNC